MSGAPPHRIGVTFPGPGGNIDRLRSPVGVSGALVTPAIEAKRNERQKKMVALLVSGEKLTSRRCEDEFGVTRDTAARVAAVEPKLAISLLRS